MRAAIVCAAMFSAWAMPATAQSLDAKSIAERAAVNWAEALGRQDKCHGLSQSNEIAELADDMAGIVHPGLIARVSGGRKIYASEIEARMMSEYHAKRFEMCSGIMKGNADHLVSLARDALDKSLAYLAE